MQTHNKFDSISKCRIHQSTQCLTELRGQLFGCEAQERGKRDDGDEVENEDSGGIPAHCASDDANGHEDKEDVDIVASECRIEEM